jgi:hypothetical protein
MVNTDRLVEVLPHYAAMLILVFLILAVLRTVVGELSFWIELVVVLIIAIGYQTLVQRLGVAPSSWRR